MGLCDCDGKTKFVVIVEVDNVRAAKAFKKALDAYELMMPKLEAWCGLQDEFEIEHQKKMKDQREESRRKLFPEYFRQLEKFEASKGSFFGGKEPEKPYGLELRECEEWRYSRLPSPHIWGIHSRIAEVKRWFAVANAATQPFRLEEPIVQMMCQCESGDFYKHHQAGADSISDDELAAHKEKQ